MNREQIVAKINTHPVFESIKNSQIPTIVIITMTIALIMMIATATPVTDTVLIIGD